MRLARLDGDLSRGSGTKSQLNTTLESHPMNRLKQLWVSEDGVAALEYALLLAFIVVGIVATLNSIGNGIHNVYVIISGSLS